MRVKLQKGILKRIYVIEILTFFINQIPALGLW